MTVDDARKFLKGSRKDVKLDALEVVSLSEKELFVIQLRYITLGSHPVQRFIWSIS